MTSYNKVILLGKLTRDPRMSYLPSQTPLVDFGLAMTRRWRGQDGEQREDTCFVDCRCFGKHAETFNQYMSKGSPVLIEGRLQLDTWEDKAGRKRSKLRVIVERFHFISTTSEPKRDTALPPDSQVFEAPPQGDTDTGLDEIPF